MKRIVCLLLLCTLGISAYAQEVYTSSGKAGGYKKNKKKGYDPDKLVLGGGLNAGYSGDYANLGISPKVGYKLTDFLSVGVGLGYQFYKAPDFSFNNEYVYIKQHIIYPNLWTKCMIFNPIFLALDVEYDFIMLNGYDVGYDPNPYLIKQKFNAGSPAVLVGPGFKQSLGGRTSATLEVMYDLLQAEYSPYRNTLVWRGGIYVGL